MENRDLLDYKSDLLRAERELINDQENILRGQHSLFAEQEHLWQQQKEDRQNQYMEELADCQKEMAKLKTLYYTKQITIEEYSVIGRGFFDSLYTRLYGKTDEIVHRFNEAYEMEKNFVIYEQEENEEPKEPKTTKKKTRTKRKLITTKNNVNKKDK